MGGKIAVQTGLAVFMIDVDKNILYLKGSVPGKPGTVVRIRDTLNKNRL
jgi:ribosomal protein L3